MNLDDENEKLLMTILIEECSEIQQAITKIFRFGIDNYNPYTEITNKKQLGNEIGDLEYIIDLLKKQNVVDEKDVEQGRLSKQEKIEKYHKEAR